MNKKICMLIICFSLMVFLSACGPVMIHLDKSEIENKVAKVELLYYDNPKQKKFAFWFFDHSDQLRPLDFENVTTLKELPSERFPSFLDQLCEAEIRERFYIYNAPKGFCVKITYNDGSFIIHYCDNTCRGYVGFYSQDGKVLDYIGSLDSYKEYSNLIDDCFDFHIDQYSETGDKDVS